MKVKSTASLAELEERQPAEASENSLPLPHPCESVALGPALLASGFLLLPSRLVAKWGPDRGQATPPALALTLLGSLVWSAWAGWSPFKFYRRAGPVSH